MSLSLSLAVASAVLVDQTTVQLAQKKENRTEWVMIRWGSRKGQISELLDLLGRLSLFRPRDIILTCGCASSPEKDLLLARMCKC